MPTTLDSSFAPFDCKLKLTGPVCTGERHVATDWGPFDFSCDVQVYVRTVSARYSTRYYDQDYLNCDRHFRLNDIYYLSTSPTGPATATISANTRFEEPFACPATIDAHDHHQRRALGHPVEHRARDLPGGRDPRGATWRARDVHPPHDR